MAEWIGWLLVAAFLGGMFVGAAIGHHQATTSADRTIKELNRALNKL